MNPLLEFYKTKKNFSILILENSSFWLYCGIYQISFDTNYKIHHKITFSEYAHQNSFQKLGIYLKKLFDSFSKIDIILCGTGPGSFTGVRLAVSTARNLSQFLKIPVVALDSLTLYSYALYKQTSNIHFITGFDAKQNKIYTKEFIYKDFLNTPIEDKSISDVIKELNQKNINIWIDNTLILNILDSKIKHIPELDIDHFVDILFLNDFINKSENYFKRNFREVLPIYLRKDPATQKYPEGLKRL